MACSLVTAAWPDIRRQGQGICLPSPVLAKIEWAWQDVSPSYSAPSLTPIKLNYDEALCRPVRLVFVPVFPVCCLVFGHRVSQQHVEVVYKITVATLPRPV